MKRRLTGWPYAWRLIGMWALGLVVFVAMMATLFIIDRLFPGNRESWDR